MKKIGLILTLASLSCSTIIGATTYLSIENSSYSIEQIKENNKDSISRDKTPIDYFGQTPILTQKTGPIISYGSKISALDWYGTTLWSFDFYENKNYQYFPGKNPKNHTEYTNRAFINWSLDSKNNILWLLTNSTKDGTALPQNIIGLNSLTGEVIDFQTLNVSPYNKYRYFYQIQVLSDGNIQIYSQGNEFWGQNILYNKTTHEQTYSDVRNDTRNNNLKKLMNEATNNKAKGENRMLYLIPIKQNVNVAVFSDYNVNHNINGGTGDLFLQLVDNNLEEIKVNENSPWSKLIHIPVNVNDQYGNQTHNFSKTIYTTLDGKVYFTAWNKFFVFYPNDDGYGGIKYAVQDLPDNKRVLSYTMDVNENVYLKYWGDTRIYKLTINGDSNKTTFAFNTYYDIGSSQISSIKNNADKFVLYNVTGYSGSIMLLSSRIIDNGEQISESSDSNTNPDFNNYGIAAAIIPNINDPTSGDSKGLLNTEESFQKSSDFTINQEILSSKLPSEITRNDLTITNGFFTSNSTKKENSNDLLYPPFTISDIDDVNGTFKITANIDQIPWFTTTLPSDAIPKTIQKTFSNTQTIKNKTSWKSQESLSYDFKNTLPSELTINDINDFDPFQVSFSSQTIIDSSGNVVYPKKVYSKGSATNENGQVVINIDYKYVPLGIAYSSESDVITYHATYTYTIFDSKTSKEFYFAGSDKPATSNGNSEINISTVPQLKALSQSNLLPSSFNANNKNDFLQFINTNKSKGYPVSKTNFDVQANDSDGSLVVIAKTSNGTFQQKYIGFNKTNQYNFGFTDNVLIDQKQFSTMLPSAVNEGNIIDNLITYSGFNSSDFSVQLYPDDANGSLKVDVLLNRNYANSLGNSSGFIDYKASKIFNGFMTTEQYNGKYNITFKTDNDGSLIDIKKNTLDVIYNQIKKNDSSTEIDNTKPITIKEVKYENLNDLIEKVFIESKGSNIIENWKNYTDKIKTNIAIDNQAGTMNLSISISKELLDGYGSDLNYVISYSGFAQGNVVATNDSLTFVSNNLLSAVLDQEVLKLKPSEFKEWLLKDKNISKIIFNITGDYVKLLENNEYVLDIQTNDAYGDITITLIFTGSISNSSSLKEYSIQYNLNKNW